MGDYNGIGPEVTLKALQKINLGKSIPIWIGHKSVFDFYQNNLGMDLPVREITHPGNAEHGFINIYQIGEDQKMFSINPGEIEAEAGKWAMQAVEAGIKLCVQKKADALLTAPISTTTGSMRVMLGLATR